MRLWSVRHARGLERLYNAINPFAVGLLRATTRQPWAPAHLEQFKQLAQA
jgi:hypothetical protein